MTFPNPPPRRHTTLRTVSALAVALTAAACQAVLGPTTPTYVVAGTVRAYTSDGQVVAGADVRILDSPTEGTPIASDASGQFRVSSLAAGRHLLEVSKAGFGVWETEFTVVDRDLRMEVVLQVASLRPPASTRDTP